MSTEVIPPLAFPAGEENAPTLEAEKMDTVPSSGVFIKKEERSFSQTSSPTSPLIPLPDFMTALNMKPQTGTERGGSGGEGVESEGVAKFAKEEKLVLGLGPKEVLIEKFKKDPNGILGLLQSALSMEKLSSLLKEEHRTDSELLLQLQNRLEAAYHTLRECEESKAELAVKISETNLNVSKKRSHLESLRGELKILGDEEVKLKRRRDLSHGKYSTLKKRLNCSTEALEQLAIVSKSMPLSVALAGEEEREEEGDRGSPGETPQRSKDGLSSSGYEEQGKTMNDGSPVLANDDSKLLTGNEQPTGDEEPTTTAMLAQTDGGLKMEGLESSAGAKEGNTSQFDGVKLANEGDVGSIDASCSSRPSQLPFSVIEDQFLEPDAGLISMEMGKGLASMEMDKVAMEMDRVATDTDQGIEATIDQEGTVLVPSENLALPFADAPFSGDMIS